MQTLLRYYTFSLFFTAACLAGAAYYGWVSSGTVAGMLSVLWIVVVLSILEVSLSFDNAVVNATVLREMDPVWQQRFLTIGILIAVFGMRIVFPIAIVSIAANIGPWAAVELSLGNPQEYERIVSAAHIGIAGFGGAFLAMVGLSFFFDADKEVHWIGALERGINRFSTLSAVEIGLVLALLYGVSTMLSPEESLTFLTAGLLGLLTYIAVNALGEWIEQREEAKKASGQMVRSGLPLSRSARCELQLRRGDRGVCVVEQHDRDRHRPVGGRHVRAFDDGPSRARRHAGAVPLSRTRRVLGDHRAGRDHAAVGALAYSGDDHRADRRGPDRSVAALVDPPQPRRSG